MVMLVLLLGLLAFSMPVDAGITADELRQIAGEAERTKRERANRVNTSDMDSLLLMLEQKKEKGEGADLSDRAPDHSRASRVGESVDDHPPTGRSDTDITTRAEKTSPDVTNAATSHRNPAQAPKTTATAAPQSRKHGGAETPLQTQRKHNNSGSPSANADATQKATTPAHIYLPPPRVVASSSASSSSDAVIIKQRRFGITIGSWLTGRLSRETTNADPGLIEITTLTDIDGHLRTLPTGTMLFATKRYNSGTKRLDLRIVQGVLPGGEEIKLNALVYDDSRVAGLHGIVIENNTAAVRSGVKRGIIDAGRNIASTVTGDTPAGVVIDSTVASVAEAKQATITATDVAPYTIHVSPQKLLIQVQETF